MSSGDVVTRFAPSPTGLLHGGNYRTAIFSYLFARQQKGTFILRIEDTDRERSKKVYEDNILETLAWLGLEYDKFIRQSERLPRHSSALKRMITDGSAYLSREEAKNGSGEIRELVRFKNPKIRIKFHDMIRGDIEMDTTELGDFVIAKNVEEPLFHLAVVVDDAELGVTHVVRGEDHIANTPRQLLLYDALGYPRPQYAHLPLVLDQTRAKLSKRRGAKHLTWYRDEGYLPEALLNFLALIGWNPGTEEEIFTREELIDRFSLDRIQKSAAIFNEEKLEWFNREHIRRMSPQRRLAMIEKFIPNTIFSLQGYSREQLARAEPHILERITHFGQLRAMSDDLTYWFESPSYPPKKLFWKDEHDPTRLKRRLARVRELLAAIPSDAFTSASVKQAVWDFAEAEGRGGVLWPMRYALSGRDKSPDPFQIAEVLGKEETLRRIEKAIELLL